MRIIYNVVVTQRFHKLQVNSNPVSCFQVHCLLAPSDWQPAAGEGLSGEKTFDKVKSSL